MRYLKNYIDSIDTSSYKDGIISAVLYDDINDTHLYLFDFEYDEDGNKFCTMMCEPINKKLPYVELSIPFINQLDVYYSNYKIDKDNKDIGKHYKKVMKRLKLKEEHLLEQR